MFTNGFYHDGGYDSRIYEYSLSTAFDVATATHYSTSLTYGGFGAGEFEDLFFSSDGTKMFAMDNADNTIAEYTIMGGWDNTNTPSNIRLDFMNLKESFDESFDISRFNIECPNIYNRFMNKCKKFIKNI